MIEIKPQTSFNIQTDACAPVSDYPHVERSEGLDLIRRKRLLVFTR